MLGGSTLNADLKELLTGEAAVPQVESTGSGEWVPSSDTFKWTASTVAQVFGLFLLAGLAEIGGAGHATCTSPARNTHSTYPSSTQDLVGVVFNASLC
jgi:hypothetical protein